MFDVPDSFATALHLILAFDQQLSEIVILSLKVSLTAVLLGAVLGLPLGAAIGMTRFPGRQILIVVVNALMGLPPVVIGLIVYLQLSNTGPFGSFQLLYTPTAMIIAQTILVMPIMTALTRQIIEDANLTYDEALRSLGVYGVDKLMTLIHETRYSLITVILAAFGRAIAEVGAVIIVGGNINHVTRVMTTTIALETSKGDLSLALALGIVLMFIALGVNTFAASIRYVGARYTYA